MYFIIIGTSIGFVMSIDSINSSVSTNNGSSFARNVGTSLCGAAALTALSYTVYSIGGVYHPRKTSNSAKEFLNKGFIDLGNDVKKRYSKLFNKLSLPKFAQKIQTANPKVLCGIWCGILFKIYTATLLCLLSRSEKQK